MSAGKGPASSARILLVEDEFDIRRALEARLTHWGFSVIAVETAEAAREAFLKGAPDLCLLDVRLPGEDGVSVCRWLRKEQGFRGPIIFLTARDETADKVLGLETGADDYVTKPYDFRELVARIRAQLRSGVGAEKVLEKGPIRIDHADGSVQAGGRVRKLTRTEQELLTLLIRASPNVLTRKELLQLVWGYSDEGLPSTRTVDMHVSRLRDKLGEAGKCLKTVPGVGYRFQA